jgi:DNA-binding response OmpR family regulator
MDLQSLVLCSDEKIVHVLRRVLRDLDIAAEHCADPEVAIQKLSRQRFEAVIVDCNDSESAGRVLKAAHDAPTNKKAVAVAIIDEQRHVRNAFEMGANFVLYKPISAERAIAGFRAARALMKRERRRAERIPVKMPVMYIFKNSGGVLQRTVSCDLGEDGIGVRLTRNRFDRGPVHLQFSLPNSHCLIKVESELAWEKPNGQAGMRFIDLPSAGRQAIKAWLRAQLPNAEEDPPSRCKLTDLSLGACYLETPSPFPVRARLELRMRVRELEVQASGVVRVMHPDVGMGVVFIQKTEEQRKEVESFIHTLTENHGAVPELLVEPDGLEPYIKELFHTVNTDTDDPLLDLFRTKAYLPTEEFLNELHAQRC